MIDGHTVLGLITARGGSKRLPGKHLRDLGGKPLIAWTVEAARTSRHLDRLVLSTDDAAIMAAAEAAGCEVPFRRPPELAGDDTPHGPVIHHAIETLERRYDYVVLLQPTSPLRTAEDIDGCIETCMAHGATTCVTVCPAPKPPYWTVRLDDGGRMTRAVEPPHDGSADIPAWHIFNGAVYVTRTDAFLATGTLIADDTIAHVMPAARSVDIDTELDLAVAGVLAARRT